MQFGDDWDEFDEFDEPEKEESEGFLTTPRILVALALAALIAVFVGRLVLHEKPQLAEIHPQLVGLWTCNDPEKSEFYVEFRRNFVVFGTGGTDSVKNNVIGSDVERVGDLNQHTVYYKDMAGTRHIRDVLLDSEENTIRFTDQPRISWSKFDD